MNITQAITSSKSVKLHDEIAPESLDELRRFLNEFSEEDIHFATETTGNRKTTVEAPKNIVSILKNIIDILAEGESVAIAAIEEQLTTQEAADILNVSRQYLVRLLSEGKIPFTKAGTHRRVLMKDVLAFKAQRDQKRRTALQELTQLSEEFHGYPERD